MIAAIISRDAALRTKIEAAVEGSAEVDSVFIIPEYPRDSDIRALEKPNETCIVFMDFRDNSERAHALAGELNRSCPSVGVVALNVGSSQADLIAIVRAGICEVLPQLFSTSDVATAVFNVARKLAGTSGVPVRHGTVNAFLPAKPGAGASSLAVYSALACARLADCHPALLDFDLRLGTTSFVLKLDSTNSIVDALQNASRMDRTLWGQLISQRERLDVLGSAPAEFGTKVPLESFQSILKWARLQNSTVIVDLPGNMDDFEIATLQQAGTIFLVCGPDLTGLHMARRKIERLRSLQLLDHVAVVVNRMDKHTGLSRRDIDKILDLPIQVIVPSDERSITEAVQAGTGVNPKTALGIQIELIARKMTSNPLYAAAPAPRAQKRRFVEFFSIPQVKGNDLWRL